jgi:hypothetical protein
MRYHWLSDRVRIKQFDVYWRPGRENLVVYHPKHHSAQHHKDMRRLILHQANILQVLRGYVRLLPLPQPLLPSTVKLRTCLTKSSNPILASSMPPPRQTRSQTTIHARDITNAPLLPRVVTPMTRNPSPPRVPTRSRNISPHNLYQDDFCGMDTAHMAIAFGNNHWSQQHLANAVIHPITGK